MPDGRKKGRKKETHLDSVKLVPFSKVHVSLVYRTSKILSSDFELSYLPPGRRIGQVAQ
jgi:hypothetical protein